MGETNRVLILAFFFCEISAERSRPDHGRTAIGTDLGVLGSLCGGAVVDAEVSCNGPFGTTDELGCLIKLGSHVEVVDAAIVENHERIDLEVSKVEICVDIVESDDEIYQSILALSREGRPNERLDGCTRGKELCVDGNF